MEHNSGIGEIHKTVWNGVRFPGITPGASKISRHLESLPKRVAVLYYRENVTCLWIVFVGGTGTGKSTLFNALCGEEVSATGAERPKTRGPVLYCHTDCPLESEFPYRGYTVKRLSSERDRRKATEGEPAQILIHEHQRSAWSQIVVADTPDLDSVAPEHRQTARDLALLSDRVVFVTSQEKYADEVPFQFLANLTEQGDPFFFLLNKVQGDLAPSGLLDTLTGEGVALPADRVWSIPWHPSNTSQKISHSDEFGRFAAHLSEEILAKNPREIQRATQKRRATDLGKSLDELIRLLESENSAAGTWLHRLSLLQQKTTQDLLRSEREQFAEQSRRHLAREIRKLFARYDVLAGPRRFLRNVVLKPFRLVGLARPPEEEGLDEQLRKVRDRVDLTPIVAALEDFHRRVLETLSPDEETSPLFSALRNPDLPFRQDEIRARVWNQQEQLARWLEAKFQDLSKGIPRSKKLGIYGTSVTWGILIIAFETALGGGFTVLDAALDSVLAPMVTKGSVELFAYREIHNVARELAKRYETGLLSILDEQRKRYEDVLQSLLTRKETLHHLEQLRNAMTEW